MIAMGALKDGERYQHYKDGFARRFRIACAQCDMKYIEVAKAIGTSTSAIYSYAHAERLPSAYTLSKIAIALNIDANKLLGIRRRGNDEDC